MAGAAASGGKERPVKPLGWVWFSGLMLGMTACLPYIIEYMCSKSYATHRHGVVLVTSATSAVGKAACLALLADGYTVYGGVRVKSEEHLVKELGSPKILPIVLDIHKSETIEAAVGKVKSELEGRAFTALVNTIEAGGSTSPMEMQDLPYLKRLLETNTVGTLGLVQIFLPLIREQGSRIVLMSSLCAHLTPPLFGGLCASKAALESLADAMRRELAPFQISISSIEPAVTSPAEENEGGGQKAREVYAHLFADDKAQVLVSPSAAGAGGGGAAAAAADAVARAVIHAVSSTHPKIRYPAGRVGRLPAPFVAFVSWGLPGRVQDVLLG